MQLSIKIKSSIVKFVKIMCVIVIAFLATWLWLTKQPKMQYKLGQMYDYGHRLPVDNTQAAFWYLKAAEQGHVKAQNRLGNMYVTGEGVTKDYKKSLEWHHIAAEQGYLNAKYNIGISYVTGKGAPQDDVKAFDWFHKAAKQGHLDAQYNIGVLYAKGQGVSIDESKAIYWWETAAERGHLGSKEKLNLAYKHIASSLRISGKEKGAVDKKSINKLISSSARQSFENEYSKKSNPKVFVQSNTGAWQWKSQDNSNLTLDKLKQKALKSCNNNSSIRTGHECKVVNVNGRWIDEH